ncbi:hypothetical protein LJC31_08005 [Synergistaceae bacterium OttesenSCG-928-I11]|nr:hypothetical protein [Synergistaceae bacterium OttesenSCG-928-I11]
MLKIKHISPSFDDFLKEERIEDEVNQIAINRVKLYSTTIENNDYGELIVHLIK